MMRFSAFLAVSLLIPIVAVAAPKDEDKVPQVDIANTPDVNVINVPLVELANELPIPVDVFDPYRGTPTQFYIGGKFEDDPSPSGFQTLVANPPFENFYTVPDGFVLKLEQAVCRSFQPPGTPHTVSLTTGVATVDGSNNGSAINFLIRLPFEETNITSGPRAVYLASANMTAYVGSSGVDKYVGGRSLFIRSERPNTIGLGTVICDVAGTLLPI